MDSYEHAPAFTGGLIDYRAMLPSQHNFQSGKSPHSTLIKHQKMGD